MCVGILLFSGFEVKGLRLKSSEGAKFNSVWVKPIAELVDEVKSLEVYRLEFSK